MRHLLLFLMICVVGASFTLAGGKVAEVRDRDPAPPGRESLFVDRDLPTDATYHSSLRKAWKRSHEERQREIAADTDPDTAAGKSYEVLVVEFAADSKFNPIVSSREVLHRIRKGDLEVRQTLRCRTRLETTNSVQVRKTMPPIAGDGPFDREGDAARKEELRAEMTVVLFPESSGQLDLELQYESSRSNRDQEHAPPVTESFAVRSIVTLPPGTPVILGGATGENATYLCIQIDKAR